MCWGKEFWFYCHSDHWYHYPAHSYYLWENGSQVVRMLAWNLKSWKKIDLSPGKVLEKVLEIFFWKREWTLAFLGKAVSQSLSLHSPSGIGYKLASSKTWWNAEEGGGGNLWWTNILSRRVGRSNSFSCFMLQKLGETLAAMWANAVCIVISQVYDYWKSNFVPKGVFFISYLKHQWRM